MQNKLFFYMILDLLSFQLLYVNMKFFVAVAMVLQAWYISATKRLGRWAGLCNPVPNTTREQLHLQIQHHRTRRHSLVARPFVLAPGDRLWSPTHPPSCRPILPVPQTSQGIPHHTRYLLNSFKSLTRRIDSEVH